MKLNESVPSVMDMDSEMEVGAHTSGNNLSIDSNMNASGHHSMLSLVATIRSLPQVQKFAASSTGAFNQSKTISLCDRGACGQASVSSSPPRMSAAPHAYVRSLPIHLSSAVNSLAASVSLSPVTSPPINLAVDLLTTLRI